MSERAEDMTRRDQILTLVASIAALFVVFSAMVGLNTAIPTLAADTGASQLQVTWLIDGYILALASLLLVGGWIADRFGRRRVLAIGLVVFGVASLAPLVGSEPELLIASRVLSGCAAAGLLPSTLSMITATFSDQERARAVTVWAVACVASGGLGLIASGFMLNWAGWQACFYFPAGIAFFVFGLSYLCPESRSETKARFDGPGSVLSVMAIGFLVLGVVEGPQRGWIDPLVLGAVIASAISAIAFAHWELRQADPLLDVRLFAERRFAASALSLLIQFGVMYGFMFVSSQVLQSALEWGPVMSGVIFAAIAIPMIPLAAVARRFELRVGSRWCNLIAMALTAGACFIAGMGVWTLNTGTLVTAILILGAGAGLASPTATTGIVESVSSDQQGVASAVNDAAREIGAALGIALSGSVLAASYSRNIAAVAGDLPGPLSNTVSDSVEGALAVAQTRGTGQSADALANAARQAFLDGAQATFLVLGGCVVVLAVVLILVSPSIRSRKPLARPLDSEYYPTGERSLL